MPEVLWPSSTEVQAAVAERIGRLLDECGGLVADFGRRTMSGGSGVLSERPNSLTPVLVSYACLSAGGDWRVSVWPAAGAEYMMAAADLFDDVADADPGGDAVENRGVLLTAAAGLLSLANLAVVRVIDDGASPTTAVALVTLLASGFAAAANAPSLNRRALAR